jgi:hypothetical protein
VIVAALAVDLVLEQFRPSGAREAFLPWMFQEAPSVPLEDMGF